MSENKKYLIWMSWLIYCLVGALLAQTYLLPYWIGMTGGLIGWLFFRNKKIGLQTLNLPFLIFINLILIGLLGNNLITRNQSLTITDSINWVLVILIWMTAVLRPPDQKNKNLIWLGGLILVIAIGIISLSTWFFPALRLLPEMNFLYATFGHNHWSIWLITSLPWIVLADKIWPHKIWKWLTGGWILWLFSTFGRWATGIGLAEIFVLWIWLRQDAVWRKWLMSYFLIGLGLLMSLLIWSNWLASQSVCPNFLQKVPQLCKSIKSEQRPEYWRQAFVGISKQPIFGFGLGGFGNISLNERDSPFSFSSFVHNDYLQWIVEAGWVGWLITFGLWWSWWKNRPFNFTNKSKKLEIVDFWFSRMIWLSAGAILINSLVDFDLHFITVMIFLVVCLGWLEAEKNQQNQKTSIKLLKFKIQANLIAERTQKIQKVLGIILVIICVSWGALYGLTNYWWENGYKPLVWQQKFYFPAFSFLLVDDFFLATPVHQDKIFKLWLNEPTNLERFLTKQSTKLTNQQKIILIERLYQLNPWSRVNFDLVEIYLQEKNWPKAQQALFKDVTFFSQQEAKYGVSIAFVSDEVRWKIAKQAIQLATFAFENNQLATGLEDLVIVNKYEPWAFNDENFKFGVKLQNWLLTKSELSPMEEAQLNQILGMTASVDPKFFGSERGDLAKLALFRLGQLASQSKCELNKCDGLENYALTITGSDLWVKQDLAKLGR